MRGEEWISSTPKHVLLYDWLGWERPAFAHMPLLRNTDKSKISKRKNPAARLTWFLEQGYLPEALRNFLALMGYSQPDGDGGLHLRRHGRATSTGRGSTPSGRSSTWTSWTGSTGTTSASCPSRTWPAGSPITSSPARRAARRADRRAARRSCGPRRRWSTSGCRCSPRPRGCSASCSSTSADFAVDADDAAKVLTPRRAPVLEAAVHGARRRSAAWTTADIEAALRTALVEGLGLKPKLAFGPVRVAVTGRRVSPPLFESLELLGRDRSLARLRAALEGLAAVTLAAGAADGRSSPATRTRGCCAPPRSRGGARSSGCCSPALTVVLRRPSPSSWWRWSSRGRPAARRDAEDALDPDTALGLLANNLVIATMIPAAVLAVLVVHRSRSAGWRRSTARVRWRLLGRCSCWRSLVVVRLLRRSASCCRRGAGDGRLASRRPARWSGLLAVILLTTPLQAAAEEVGFRGYLTQAVSSWFARPAVGIAAGVARQRDAASRSPTASRTPGCSATGWRSAWSRPGWPGGPAGWRRRSRCTSRTTWSASRSPPSTGSLEESLSASTLDWQFAVLDVAMMLAFAFLVDRLVRRRSVVTRRVLSAPDAVGYPGPRPPTPPPAGSEIPWGMG